MLSFVEAVNLVYEQDSFLLIQFSAFLSLLHYAAQVIHAGTDSAYRAEVRIGGIGNDISQGSFTAARRAPQDN